jgi:predicted unusual protein kinase regulating ubiquinone biosynthesis (AarF/ABC1/UbiB family)/nucleotide-binding universal stress UspA family protein
MVQRVVVATDRSETAARAVSWAADMAGRFAADLVLVQVLAPDLDTEELPEPRVDLAATELSRVATDIAGPKGRARVVVDDDPAVAILRVAEEERADVVIVGNAGMAGRKKFLLGNVPNRISHLARCTVIVVNTASADGRGRVSAPVFALPAEADEPEEPMLTGRAATIARVAAKHGLKDLLSRSDRDADDMRSRARRLRTALEELGPTFCKLGQILSTRPDLVPPEVVDELAALRDRVPPLTEAAVVEVMEEELGVPWEDVFDSIEPQPLASGTIAQVHRATLTNGERVVVKVQRPTAREEILRDLGLLELFARKSAARPALSQVVDPEAVVGHLSESLQRELDFRQEAANLERMQEVLRPYPRLGVPAVYNDFSTDRLLVMEEIGVGPLSSAPQSKERKEAARQLIESYYRQILVEGFFHADPHPGNMKWWDGKVYFLDFGMVGEVGPHVRDGLTLLLLAFWREDVEFLADMVLQLSGEEERYNFDVNSFRDELGTMLTRYRHLPLHEIQLGPMLQDITAISIRHDVALPAPLVLTGKALAQIQLATAELDPDLDPFSVAGSFLAKSAFERLRNTVDPQTVLYESQKIRVRVGRLIEAFERLTGARPGPKLQVHFRGIEGVESGIRRASRRLSLALVAVSTTIATAMTADSSNVGSWVPIAFGAVSAVLTAGLVVDISRPGR